MRAPQFILSESKETQLLISLSGSDKMLSGRLITLCKLYASLPQSLIGRLTDLSSTRSLLLDKKHEGKLNYNKFREFFADLGSSPRKPASSNLEFYSVSITPIAEGDDWWLKELDFDESIAEVCMGLSAVIKDVEARASERNSIIDDILSI